MRTLNTNDIRCEFARLLNAKKFTSINREASMTSIVGKRTIEIVGASFVADEETIFGAVNHEYIAREKEWYESLSRNVNDFPGGAPAIWKAIAAKDGTVNSNYGNLLFSDENGRQFDNIVKELLKNPESRRAVAIYTRPSMWNEYNLDGRSDFVCTNCVQYLVRDGRVNAVVQMRSNDSTIGYRNDYVWQVDSLKMVAEQLNLVTGDIVWQVGSLHVYERDFYLVDHFLGTAEFTVTKKKYCSLYPNSEYNPLKGENV